MLTPPDELRPGQPPSTQAPAPAPDEASPVAGRMAEPALRAVAAQRAGDEAATATALQELCDEAHRGELPVERVIVLLKELWQANTPPERPARSRVSPNRLAQLVSACIVAYYQE